MIKKLAISAVPLAAAGAAAALALGGTAYAAAAAPPGPVTIAANHSGEAGYEASVLNDSQTYFTHITAAFGLGNPQYGADNPSLPVNSATAFFLGSEPRGIPFHVSGPTGFALPTAARIGLDEGDGTFNAAETAIVPVSSTRYDVIGVYGTTGTAFGATDITSGEAVVLLKNIPYTDTSQLDVLYDGRHNYDGFQAGTPTFYAKDLSNPRLPADRVNIFELGTQRGKEFFHAVAGEVNAPRTATTIGSVVPVDGDRSQISVLLAHTFLNGNSADGSEFYGTLQSGAAWTVVADASEDRNGNVYQAPGPFFDDHFAVYSGL